MLVTNPNLRVKTTSNSEWGRKSKTKVQILVSWHKILHFMHPYPALYVCKEGLGTTHVLEKKLLTLRIDLCPIHV